MGELLSDRDLRGLTDVVEGRRDEPTDGLPWAVLDGLAALVPCDAVSFYEADVAHYRTTLLQWNEPGDRCLGTTCDEPETKYFWDCARRFAPCGRPPQSGPVTWSDCYSPGQLRGVALYADFYGPAGWRGGMHLAFPALPGHTRKISFWRGPGPDFTARDRLVVELLRPHLWEIHAETQRRRVEVPRLTEREWEVLELVRHGYANLEIARHLCVSVSTVRKHLEHVFARTGARSRTEAVALMMPRH